MPYVRPNSSMRRRGIGVAIDVAGYSPAFSVSTFGADPYMLNRINNTPVGGPSVPDAQFPLTPKPSPIMTADVMPPEYDACIQQGRSWDNVGKKCNPKPSPAAVVVVAPASSFSVPLLIAGAAAVYFFLRGKH